MYFVHLPIIEGITIMYSIYMYIYIFHGWDMHIHVCTCTLYITLMHSNAIIHVHCTYIRTYSKLCMFSYMYNNTYIHVHVLTYRHINTLKYTCIYIVHGWEICICYTYYILNALKHNILYTCTYILHGWEICICLATCMYTCMHIT